MTQQEALNILKLGYNVFLTGAAGSGKTYLLTQYIQYLKDHSVGVAVTASTGIAATHMDGLTIHSLTGIGIKDNLTYKEIRSLAKRPYLVEAFTHLRVLIIDEISMLDAPRLDLINTMCCALRDNTLSPFGGLQVVLCGDFFQLPPVRRAGEVPKFAYESLAWKDLGLSVCYLEEQYRQEDAVFLRVLNDIRNSTVTEETKQLLAQRVGKSVQLPFSATKLFTHNQDVDALNNAELLKIIASPKNYLMRSSGQEQWVTALKRNCLAPEMLTVKVGAVVMFVKNNFEVGYVNGTLGEVVDFADGYPVVLTAQGKHITAYPETWKTEEDKVTLAEVTQVPLRLAWAITVHKSQGMSLDAAIIDLSRAFEAGMGYVALSRVRSLQGISLLGINDTALGVHEQVVQFDKELLNASVEEVQLLRSMPEHILASEHERFLHS